MYPLAVKLDPAKRRTGFSLSGLIARQRQSIPDRLKPVLLELLPDHQDYERIRQHQIMSRSVAMPRGNHKHVVRF